MHAHLKRNTETYDKIDGNLQEVIFHHQEEAKKTFFQFFFTELAVILGFLKDTS